MQWCKVMCINKYYRHMMLYQKAMYDWYTNQISCCSETSDEILWMNTFLNKWLSFFQKFTCQEHNCSSAIPYLQGEQMNCFWLWIRAQFWRYCWTGILKHCINIPIMRIRDHFGRYNWFSEEEENHWPDRLLQNLP